MRARRRRTGRARARRPAGRALPGRSSVAALRLCCRRARRRAGARPRSRRARSIWPCRASVGIVPRSRPKLVPAPSRPLVSRSPVGDTLLRAMAASRLEFRILGPLAVRVDGTSVPIGGPKQRALLALLLLNANRVVPRERLIVELFAE